MCTSRSPASTCWFWPACCCKRSFESISDALLGTRVFKIRDRHSTDLNSLLPTPVELVYCSFSALPRATQPQKPDFPDENWLIRLCGFDALEQITGEFLGFGHLCTGHLFPDPGLVLNDFLVPLCGGQNHPSIGFHVVLRHTLAVGLDDVQVGMSADTQPI